MSEQWPVKPLAGICEIFSDGDWIESKDQSPSGIRLVQTGNIGGGVFKNRKDKARYISESTFSRLNCTEIFEGDCLISRLPRPVGRACLIPNTGERMITAVDCSILRFKQDLILPQFFVYYSQSKHYDNQIQPLCTGSTRKRISRKNLGKITIPIPTLDVQQRIVDSLDEVFDKIDDSVDNIQFVTNSIKELFETKLQTVFHEESLKWEKMPFEESIVKVKATPKIKKREFKESGSYPIISQEIDYINGYWNNSDDLLTIQTPVVVFGDHTKTLKYIDFDFVRGADGLKVLQPIESILPKFFYHQLRSVKLDTLGYARHYRLLKQVDIRVPSMEKQHKIASMFDELDEQVTRLNELYEQEYQSLGELNHSILQEAFNGNL